MWTNNEAVSGNIIINSPDYYFNDLFYLFGKPRNLVFNCKNTKDIMPSYWEETEEGYKCTCRTVGIAPSDVHIEVKNDCIIVSGETEFDGYKYNTKYELPVAQDVLTNIKKVKCKTAYGITVIYLEIERPKKSKIEIEYL